MIPVFDGHNDTVLQHLDDPARDFFARHDDGHLDAVRAAEGGLVGGFFAVYTRSPAVGARYQDAIEAAGLSKPTPLGAIDPTDAVRNTNAAVATILGWAADPEGRFRVARSVAELEAAMADGVMAGVLHFEGAEAIGPDLAALDVYHAAGLRSLGPVWSRPNLFAEGVPFAYPSSPDTGPGLTAHGRALVRRCNELRIMIDLSHINERGFWDVAALSDAPLVATHSNAHAICPSARNLTDEQLAAVRASQGVVGLNFAVAFLAPDGDGVLGAERVVRWDAADPDGDPLTVALDLSADGGPWEELARWEGDAGEHPLGDLPHGPTYLLRLRASDGLYETAIVSAPLDPGDEAALALAVAAPEAGEVWSGLREARWEATHPEESARRARVGKFYYRPPGGESWADVILRVRSILVELQERFHGERVWLFSHEAVILAFRYVVEGLDEQRVVALQKEEPLANCSMTRYRAVDGALQLVRADDTRPVEESDEAHVTHETDDAAEDAEAGQDT